MFGGIVENQGVLTAKRKAGGQIRLQIRFKKSEKNLKIGESIAVNGVCLTVAQKTGQSFSCDVMKETLKATTLGLLEKGSAVNLERALRFGARVGGHFISGHVDGTGTIEEIKKEKKNQIWVIKTSPAIIRGLAVKGSVALDGISLTVQNIQKNQFEIALIPHTLKATALKTKKAGDSVNLEIDQPSRYAQAGKTLLTPAAVKKQIQQLSFRGF